MKACAITWLKAFQSIEEESKEVLPDDAEPKSDNKPLPHHIHLEKVLIFGSGQDPIALPVWRVRLSSVSGFAFVGMEVTRSHQ
jgi:hypothetical protein